MELLTKQANRRQMFYCDDSDIEFRVRPIIGASVIQKDNTGEPVAAWSDFFQTLYPFDGYMGIPGGAIQLAYGRHFHLEIHDILSEEIRPPDDDAMDSPYIAHVAESRAIQLAKAAKPRTVYEKLTMILGGGLILEFLLWGLQIATR